MPSNANSFGDLTQALRHRLSGPLPGLFAQRAMAPSPRRLRPGGPDETTRTAAVLALLFPDPSRRTHAQLLLTRRTETVGHHKGQVCLPGGALNDDESPREAACREVEEELGIDRRRIQVLGALTTVFVPVSGFVIHPFVGSLATPPDGVPDPHEVAEQFSVPLADLLNPALRGRRTEIRGETELEIPFFRLGGREVWGATAMMLAELCALLDHPSG